MPEPVALGKFSMKFFCAFFLISFVSAAQSKTYRFIGQFQEYDYADGYFWYTFAGPNGKTKEFIQLDVWEKLNLNLQRIDLYAGKWFEVRYYSVYDGLGDDEEKRWFRRIKSIKIIPIPGKKTYTFIGEFKSASVLEGSGYYTFTGLNGKPKHFAHDIQWQQELPYDFFDFERNSNQSYINKWFRITYYGVYGFLSGEDGATASWHRKIYTIEMIPIPRSRDVIVSDTSRLYDFRIFKGSANFNFQDGPNTYLETKCDTSTLKQFPFDFKKEHAFKEKYHERLFEFQYKIEYLLESEEPVTRTIVALKILE